MKIFRELNYRGLFIIIDCTLPVSERSELWQFNMWRDWIKETIEKSYIEDKEKKLQELLPITENKNKDDMPSCLIEQLTILKNIGFRDIDCFYKYGIFTLFGGTKW